MRKRRVYSKTGIYHVVIRGVNKQNIFFEKEDKLKFLQLLKKYSRKNQIKICAYCLMDNHVHLLIEDPNTNISIFMQSVCSLYARIFNKKYDRIGHLFQERFASEVVEDDEYFLTVYRYVLQNPEAAGVCKTENYFWSNFRLLEKKNNFIDNTRILDSFNSIEALYEFLGIKTESLCLEIELRPSEKENSYISKVKQILKSDSPIIKPDLPKKELMSTLRKLKESGLSVRTISRVTGIGKYQIQIA